MFAKTLNTGKTHMTLEMDESLPTVTEGVPVRNHHHHHLSSANIIATSSDQNATSINSAMPSSLRSKLACKRNSVDDTATTSCSSSTSLDGSSSGGGGGGRLSRRRSSTVSQCSSVLSEGTRQQLNFDLSPDLPLDSSILDANTISPVDDFERPASPEPSSEPLLDGGSNEDESSFDMRPTSRMSGTFCSSAGGDDEEDEEIMLTNVDSPGSNKLLPALDHPVDSRREQSVLPRANSSEQQHETNIRDNLERIISHVSTVRVSCGGGGGGSDAIAREPHETVVGGVSVAGQKRAHTPFGLNIQRNKTTHMSPATPSPTAAGGGAKVSAATCE